jgi:biopolymer transport protein ExbB
MTPVHFLQSGGLVMWPLLALSFAAVALIIERAAAFQAQGNPAPELAARVERLAVEGDYKAARQACEGVSGPVAACLSVILEYRERETAFIERKVEEVGQGIFHRLERNLPLLSIGATVSPLLGLLGTVSGMIGTFNAIAAAKTQGNADSILAGIGEALYATATGITIAVICYLAYGYFTARLRFLTGEVESVSTRLINLLLEQGVPAGSEALR